MRILSPQCPELDSKPFDEEGSEDYERTLRPLLKKWYEPLRSRLLRENVDTVVTSYSNFVTVSVEVDNVFDWQRYSVHIDDAQRQRVAKFLEGMCILYFLGWDANMKGTMTWRVSDNLIEITQEGRVAP